MFPNSGVGMSLVLLKTPWQAALLAQDPNMTHLVLSSKGHCEFSMEKRLGNYTEVLPPPASAPVST